MDIDPFGLVLSVAAIVIGIMMVLRFFRMADDIKRLADKLAGTTNPPPISREPAPTPAPPPKKW